MITQPSPSERSRSSLIRRITQRIPSVPTLPEVMTHIIQMVDNPSTTALELAEVIGKDQALAAKILKLANSAFYGFPQKIGTIHLAIVVLGFQSVKDLGLSAAVMEVFNDEDFQGPLDLHQFWIHTIAVAAGCKVVGTSPKITVSGEIFVAGLLHDIGKLVLCRHLNPEYQEVLETAQRTRKNLTQVENQLLGFNHADVGGWIAEQWNLPRHQVNALAYHPYPWLTYREPNIGMIVNFANLLAYRAGYPAVDGLEFPIYHHKVGSYLNLKRKGGTEDVDWDFYIARLNDEMERARGFLKLLRQNEG
ncbi:MAG: HDOD domain-containing protein [bacterium]